MDPPWEAEGKRVAGGGLSRGRTFGCWRARGLAIKRRDWHDGAAALRDRAAYGRPYLSGTARRRRRAQPHARAHPAGLLRAATHAPAPGRPRHDGPAKVTPPRGAPEPVLQPGRRRRALRRELPHLEPEVPRRLGALRRGGRAARQRGSLARERGHHPVVGPGRWVLHVGLPGSTAGGEHEAAAVKIAGRRPGARFFGAQSISSGQDRVFCLHGLFLPGPIRFLGGPVRWVRTGLRGEREDAGGAQSGPRNEAVAPCGGEETGRGGRSGGRAETSDPERTTTYCARRERSPRWRNTVGGEREKVSGDRIAVRSGSRRVVAENIAVFFLRARSVFVGARFLFPARSARDAGQLERRANRGPSRRAARCGAKERGRGRESAVRSGEIAVWSKGIRISVASTRCAPGRRTARRRRTAWAAGGVPWGRGERLRGGRRAPRPVRDEVWSAGGGP